MENITYYNLTNCTNSNPFPMWHKLTKLPDGNYTISMANKTAPLNDSVFSIATLNQVSYYQQIEVVEEREHAGKFEDGVKALFYRIKCRPVSYDPNTGSIRPLN